MIENIKVHPTACVSEQAEVGEGTSIWQNCVIMEGAVIGNNCMLGANAFIENGVVLGNRVKVKNNIALYTGVKCEDDVFLGTNCVFTNVKNPRSFISRKTEFKDTVVKQGATIGANTTIICGNVIGKYAFVGAGAVITKDVPDYGLVMGNPSRLKGYICKCGNKLLHKEQEYMCSECRNRYKMEDGKIVAVEEN